MLLYNIKSTLIGWQMSALFLLACSWEPLVWHNCIFQVRFTNAFLFADRNSNAAMVYSGDDLL